jgi:hypothetical protein
VLTYSLVAWMAAGRAGLMELTPTGRRNGHGRDAAVRSLLKHARNVNKTTPSMKRKRQPGRKQGKWGERHRTQGIDRIKVEIAYIDRHTEGGRLAAFFPITSRG